MKRQCLPALVLLLLSSVVALGGGSIHRDDLQALWQSNPKLAGLIQKNYQIGEVGDAIRLGRHMGDLGGARMGPYEFPAKTQQGSLEVILILHTQTRVKDSAGKVIPMGNLTPEMSGLSLSETLLSYEVKLKPRLVPQGQSVGEVVSFLSSAKLEWAEKEFESDDEPGFVGIRKGAIGGVFRRVQLNVGMGDHYAVSVEVFTNAERQPVFTLVTESSWSFVEPEKTEDSVTETRLYFEGGQLTKALEKSYQFREESQQKAKRDAAVNQKISVDQESGARLYRMSAALLNEMSPAPLRRYAEAFAALGKKSE